MRPLSVATIAGILANNPALISPKAGDSYELAEQVNFVAAFGALTDVVSPLAPIPPISKVEFFDGVTLLATANAFPWIAYVPAATLGAGAHTVSCLVTYTSGAKRTSTTKAITILAAPSTNLGSFAAVKCWADGTDASKYTPSSPVPGTSFISALANNQGTAVFSNFAQATGARQPTVDYVRGNLCLLFGAGSSQQHIDSVITGTVAQPWQVLQGYRQCGSGTTGTVWAGSTGGNFKVNGTASDWPMAGALDANVTINAATLLPDSTAHALAFQASASGYINIDGVDAVTGSTGSRTLATLFAVGAGSTGLAAVSAGIAEIAIATALSGADQTTAKAALKAKLHTGEPAAKRFDQMDSLGVGTGSTTGLGWRPMIWFGAKPWAGSGTGTAAWAFSQAKCAGRWVESAGPLTAGTVGLGFIDDQTYCNSGKGINFALANVGARINAGQPYASRNITVFNWGAGNARNLAGETFVPGTGAGSTYDTWVQAAILSADAGSMLGMVWLNLIDTDPVNTTYAANLRTMNAYWQQAIAAVRAARPSFKIVGVDAFNFLGLFTANPTRWNVDGIHLSDTGYPIYGNAIGQGIAQLCALLP